MSFLHRKKDPLLNCLSYTNPFVFTRFGCNPVITEINGILPLTSLGTGTGPTWTVPL